MEDTIPAPAGEPIKRKITFTERFLKCSSIHNRIDRSGFFLNIIVMSVLIYAIYSFLWKSLIIGLMLGVLLMYFYFIQIKKRCHDFNITWNIVAMVILIITLSPIWTQWVFMFLLGLNDYLEFIFRYGTYIFMAIPIPYIILALIPGNSEVNDYGDKFSL